MNAAALTISAPSIAMSPSSLIQKELKLLV
jgi:hypothetical protein